MLERREINGFEERNGFDEECFELFVSLHEHIYKMFLGRVGYCVVGSGMSFIREHVLLNISLVSSRFERSKLFFFYR